MQKLSKCEVMLEEGRRKEGRGRRKEGGGKEEWGKLLDSPTSKDRGWLVGETGKKFTVP